MRHPNNSFVNEKLVADEKLLRIFIKITDGFLVSYYVQESEGNYIIQKKPSGYNYVDAVSSDLQDELFAAHFFRIPDKVQEILEVERKDYFFASNENMLEKAIERIENPIKLFSFAKDAGIRILRNFFKQLKNINIDTAITKSAVETSTASISFTLLNMFILNIDFVSDLHSKTCNN